MELIPKIEPRQEKKIVSARLDEETHTMLVEYGEFLGDATYDYIIAESLKRRFRRDCEFKEWRATRKLNSEDGGASISSAESVLQSDKQRARFA